MRTGYIDPDGFEIVMLRGGPRHNTTYRAPPSAYAIRFGDGGGYVRQKNYWVPYIPKDDDGAKVVEAEGYIPFGHGHTIHEIAVFDYKDSSKKGGKITLNILGAK